MSRMMKVILASFLLMTTLVGCGSKKDDEMPLVSVAQIVQHSSLNEIRDAFKDEMKTLGYEEGKNIRYNFKDAGGDLTTANSIMSAFAGDKSNVIVAIATPTAAAAANYSKEIPIVFSAVTDPILANLVTDLDKPDKNITGTSDEVQIDKIIALAKTVDPDIKTLGFLYNASEANSVANLKKAETYCKQNGIRLIEKSGANVSELQSAITSLIDKADAVLAPNDNTVASCIPTIIEAANKKKIPVYTGADSMVKDGGFATIGISYKELGHETAKMVDQILKGKSVADIPVKVFRTDLKIYVNEKTMQTLDITLPASIKNNKDLILLNN